MHDVWREPARQKQWTKVLWAIRADLTQYTIYHRTNTVPLMRVLPPEEIEILAVDIEALHETVDQLEAAYWQLGRLAEFPLVIERLRGNVDDPRWQRKLTYHQAVTAFHRGDRDGARRELAKLGPVTPAEIDLDILRLYLDIDVEDVGIAEKLRLYDRIFDLTESSADHIRYGLAKGVELLLAGDGRGAAATLDIALRIARTSEEEFKFAPDEELWLCKLLEVSGIANQEPKHFLEAATRLKSMTLTDFWAPAGLGHLNHCLGDVLRLAHCWEDAAAAYAAGFAVDGNPASRIFEASCRLAQGRTGDALSIANSLDIDALNEAERADFAIAYAAIAIATRDAERLRDAAARLRSVRPGHPYFVNDNLRARLAVDHALLAIASGVPVPKSSRLLDLIGSLSRWIMIQPNVAGFGLNINNMVDDAVARRRKAGRQEGERGE